MVKAKINAKQNITQKKQQLKGIQSKMIHRASKREKQKKSEQSQRKRMTRTYTGKKTIRKNNINGKEKTTGQKKATTSTKQQSTALDDNNDKTTKTMII